jgi:hypothetical protein
MRASDAATYKPDVLCEDARPILPRKEQQELTARATVPMDTFKWIVSGLLGALVVAVGWFLSGIQSDLRDVRKEVTGMRVDAAVTNTKLEELIAEFRRRTPR